MLSVFKKKKKLFKKKFKHHLTFSTHSTHKLTTAFSFSFSCVKQVRFEAPVLLMSSEANQPNPVTMMSSETCPPRWGNGPDCRLFASCLTWFIGGFEMIGTVQILPPVTSLLFTQRRKKKKKNQKKNKTKKKRFCIHIKRKKNFAQIVNCLICNC